MGAIASCSWQPPEAVQVESEVGPTEGSSSGTSLETCRLDSRVPEARIYSVPSRDFHTYFASWECETESGKHTMRDKENQEGHWRACNRTFRSAGPNHLQTGFHVASTSHSKQQLSVCPEIPTGIRKGGVCGIQWIWYLLWRDLGRSHMRGQCHSCFWHTSL